MFQIEMEINEDDFNELLDVGAITETNYGNFSRFHLFDKIQVEISDRDINYKKSFINFSIHDIDVDLMKKLKDNNMVVETNRVKLDSDEYYLTLHLFDHKLIVFSKRFKK